MAEVHHTARAADLLFERERQGVRTLTIVRSIFMLIIVATHWIVGVSLFEKIAATVVAALALVALCFFLFLLTRPSYVAAIGLAGCALDIAILGTLPVIWYLSVGGSDVPPAYMLKTQITVMTLGVVTLNALAIRPLYPLVVAIGGLMIHSALFAYVLNEPRTIISSDFLRSVMGPAISIEFVLTSMLIIALAGVAMAYLTFITRRTVVQAVRLEVANTHLGRYFSPGVVARIAGETDMLPSVGGRNQEVAVMFCDIRDFATITENLPPSTVVEFLSTYHRCMVDVIFEFGGTIDKFIGDAIMVTFGTPDPCDDDAERSVRAGMAMNLALADLNADREHHGLAPIRHGIGIHFGPVTAGNIGTEERLEYTVIGDTVNAASRIQDVCKSTGETLLISDAVKQRLPSDIMVRSLHEQRVKGRKAPLQIYAV